MLNSSSIIAFVPTTDPPRSRAFYEGILGLALIADEPFALVFNANGTMLRIAKMQTLVPAPYTILGWSVTDIRAIMTGLIEKGVVFERYEGLAQDELGIWTAPGGARVAWFKDPDGNVLSLTQH